MEKRDCTQEVEAMLEVFLEPTNKVGYIHAGDVWEILRLGCRDMIFSLRRSMKERADDESFAKWAEERIALFEERIDRINEIHFNG